jgi:glycosyltransferase involved in cell wall biosynthesis
MEGRMMLVSAAAEVPSDARSAHVSSARVSVVIPALNEERCIAWVLERLPSIVAEVILVDGRSTDRTVEIARAVRPDLKVVLEQAPGKGAALRAGFAAATGDYIVMLDADGSMDPDEIERFVTALQDGLDFVKGSRFADGGGTADMSLIRRLGNGALRGAVNRLYRTNMSDLCYGYMAFRRDRLSCLRLQSDGFEIETEMTVRAVTASLRIGEVASYEAPRRYGETHLHAWRDGKRVLRTLLRQRFILPVTPCELAHANASGDAIRAIAGSVGEISGAPEDVAPGFAGGVGV